MRKRLAKILVITGTVCVLAALSLFIYNKIVSANAARFAEEMVTEIRSYSYSNPEANHSAPADEHGGDSDTGMESLTIQEYDFIGYISIPALRLNLPVMSAWSYDNLTLSPCRYSGSPEGDDFVIAAHNYSSHFGFISDLNVGDTVNFIDIHGRQINYRVELIDTLSPTAVKDMTAGEYDLTLFTCTYLGQARVTVRCNRIHD